MSIKEAWNSFAQTVHETAKEKGWWDQFIVWGDDCMEVRKLTKKKTPSPHELELRADTLVCRKCGQVMLPGIALEVAFDAATQRNKGELLALVHSEISEALEGLRKGDPPNDQLPEFKYSEVELADVLIRMGDMAAALNLDVGGALEAKMQYNRGRSYRHGKNF